MSFVVKGFEAFRIGDAETFAKTITDADIVLFAGLSGDMYPLHLDAEYAKRTRFGARIAHGMLSASLLSAVNAALLGTPGGIYVAQTLHFRAPVYIGDTLTARAEIVEILSARRRLRAHTTIHNHKGELVVDGESVVQKDEVP